MKAVSGDFNVDSTSKQYRYIYNITVKSVGLLGVPRGLDFNMPQISTTLPIEAIIWAATLRSGRDLAARHDVGAAPARLQRGL